MMLEIINRRREINTLSIKPSAGDFIALNWNGCRPTDFESENQREVNWECSIVTAVDDGKYKMGYDDEWYSFSEFGTPKRSTKGDWDIYPAIPLKQ